MDATHDLSEPTQEDIRSGQEIIVRADEVDESGADISTITPDSDGNFEARVEARRQHDIQTSGSPKPLANNAAPSPPKPPARPILRREGSAPAPPKQPPPPAPQSQEDTPLMADSLSLAELKNMVKDFPKSEAAAYAYEYEDTRTFPEELEEWFQYTTEDNTFLTQANKAYENNISTFNWNERTATSQGRYKWLKLPPEARTLFIDQQLQGLAQIDTTAVSEKLDCLAYLAMGAWQETTWLEDAASAQEAVDYEPPNDKYLRTIGQLRYIKNTADILSRAALLQSLYDVLRSICDDDIPFGSSTSTINLGSNDEMRVLKFRQLNAILTILYFMVESGRQQIYRGEPDSIRQTIMALKPDLLQYLTSLVAKLRWDDSCNLPITRILLLLWKIMILCFGGTSELNHSKEILNSELEKNEDNKEGFLTASPLDYHIFRQEITSKYPAYNPSPPLIPLELENNSMLPPLPSHPSRSASQDSLASMAGVHSNGIGKSIFQQPVHISTPAPSPPPSPAGPGGKGGKKQNYQTNQNFPFLYPPLDETSNTIGGKGNLGIQDNHIGKKWEGNDIPASILEAGQLFASRMRMSRSLRQLWEVREEFMKFERGWEDEEGESKQQSLNEEMQELRLEEEAEGHGTSPSEAEFVNAANKYTAETKPVEETDDEEVQGRLNAVESFYRDSLPHLQSVVIVLLKIFLSNVTTLANQVNGQNGIANPFVLPEPANGKTRPPQSNINLAKHINGAVNVNGSYTENESADPALVELNAVRIREITSKAIAGILLSLLKWFKLSHILKFEYFTQLLLDSNYLPLALKYFAHQDVDTAVHKKNDREDLNFFHLCRLNSGHTPSPPTPGLPASSDSSSSSSDSSIDDAQPPPISKSRRATDPPSPQSPDSPPVSPDSPDSPPPPPAPLPTTQNPEVDELGHPTTLLPPIPLTSYSPRFFHTTTTHLRLLQKITKRKAHRCLLLVQYKSSTILRRLLKIPQHSLRLYTLKLFKSQVPFCGRKWRQTNMRVITAIYLHVRPELRDEWISGGGAVEESVEEAVPLEQAARGLVRWWHLRRYRREMGVGVGVGGAGATAVADGGGDGVEGGFFERELERMGWGVGYGVVGGGGNGTDGVEGEDGWEGPLLGEGW